VGFWRCIAACWREQTTPGCSGPPPTSAHGQSSPALQIVEHLPQLVVAEPPGRHPAGNQELGQIGPAKSLAQKRLLDGVTAFHLSPLDTSMGAVSRAVNRV
jgi:hypothetical protein